MADNEQWEVEDNLTGCQELLHEYMLANGYAVQETPVVTQSPSPVMSQQCSAEGSPRKKRRRREHNRIEVAEIYGVRVVNVCELQQNTRRTWNKQRCHEQGTYQYKVRWEESTGKSDSWVPEDTLSSTDLIDEFHDRAVQAWNFPRRGDISVVLGGPPCQGMSISNYHRNQRRPLDDSKNAMVSVYLDFVRYYRPDIVLFENVAGIFTLADGFMLRYLVTSLVSSGYQVKQALLQAAYYGVPQSRWRIIVWAARQGVKMPSYPLPTHDGPMKHPIISRKYQPFVLCSNQH